MNIAAIVVAAGRSERMGRPKPLLPCGGTTFLGAILATLATARIEIVRVVLGHRAEEIRTAVPLADAVCAINDDWESGMLSSVWRGVRALPPTLDAFLVGPVDHPLVTVATVAHLIETCARTGKGIIVPVYDGRRGHPVLFKSGLRDALLAAPPSIGLRAVAADRPDEVIEVRVEDLGVVADVDTQADFDRWVGG